MTKNYSNNLKQGVIEYVDSGNLYINAPRLFKVNVSAMGRWYRKYKREGNYLLRKRGGSERRIDLEKLEKCIKVNKDITLKKLHKNWQ